MIPRLFTFFTLIFLKVFFSFTITAEVMMDDVSKGAVENFRHKSIQLAQEESVKKARALTPEEFQELSKKVMEQELLKAKVSSVIVSSLFNQDPNIALLTGTNASQNNMIPLLLAGGMILWEGYEIYHIHQTQGDEGLLRYLATAGLITVTTGIVGKGIKVAWKINGVREPITNAGLAVQAYMMQNPKFYSVFVKIGNSFSKSGNKAGSLYNKANDALDKSYQAVINKLPFKKTNVKAVEAEHLLNKPSVPQGKKVLDSEGMSVLEKTEVHVLYVKPHSNPKVPVCVGRTRGKVKNPRDEDQLRLIVNKRDRNHHMNAKGYGEALPIKHSSDPDVIRGLEQIKIDDLGGALSQGGSSSNAINSIAKNNPKLQQYLEAAKRAITHE